MAERQRPINETGYYVPPFITKGGIKYKVRLASKARLFDHNVHGWVVLTWREVGIRKSPLFTKGFEEVKDKNTGKMKIKGGTSIADNIRGMVAIGKPVDAIREEQKKRKELMEKRFKDSLHDIKKGINKEAMDKLHSKKPIVVGDSFKDV